MRSSARTGSGTPEVRAAGGSDAGAPCPVVPHPNMQLLVVVMHLEPQALWLAVLESVGARLSHHVVRRGGDLVREVTVGRDVAVEGEGGTGGAGSEG